MEEKSMGFAPSLSFGANSRWCCRVGALESMPHTMEFTFASRFKNIVQKVGIGHFFALVPVNHLMDGMTVIPVQKLSKRDILNS